MTYYTGSVAAVPKANRDAFADHARRAWSQFEKRGARRMVEAWGEDLKPGKRTDFLRAVEAGAEETAVFSWIEWPDRATADAAWADMMADEALPEALGEMPFDGKRMIFGGFTDLVAEGTDEGAGWYQGYILTSPAHRRDDYRQIASDAWEQMFRPAGCLGTFENWAEDVPHGERTDMYRAVDARDGEAIVFSWTAWTDKAACDRAHDQMMASDMEMPEDPPFAMDRMIHAGFAPVFDSARG